MTALNPIMRIGEQIAEVIRLHEKCGRHSLFKAKEMLEMVSSPGRRYYEYRISFRRHEAARGHRWRWRARSAAGGRATTALDVTIQAQVLDMINELKELKHLHDYDYP